MNFKEILDVGIRSNASDIFIKLGCTLRGRVNLEVKTINDHVFTDEDVEKVVSEILDDSKKKELENKRGYDFGVNYGDRWRFRVAIFYQRYALSMVIRKIDLEIPSFDQLSLPAETLERFCKEQQGLVLLTGMTGSGKSTTIASMIKFIDKNLGKHILTIEEPIEFTFEDDKSIVNQRELSSDVFSYSDALAQFALHSPDVIYIGNIRDQNTCRAALTAAETGVLVFSTMHTIDARTTIERIVNFFSPEQHDLVFNQLSSLLKGAMSLRLVPRADGQGLIPAYEVMTLSPGISTAIRERKIWEIPKYVESGEIHGMKSFNQCLSELVEAKKITTDTALEKSNNKDDLALHLRRRELI
ncbi:MAG: PilT/PilU family type 4a pilus ATPase [Candidatus Omnitrophota bacterium]